jgi:FkbM family methyltransferase
MKHLLHLSYALLFPLYSLFSRRIGFCVFWPGPGGWWAYTRGKVFPVRMPRVWVLEYFRHFVADSGDLVFDVGGELGFETEQFSRMVGPKGRVVVFECFPDHVARLKAIAAKRSNVTLVERACWDRPTSLEFFVGHTPGSNTAVPDAKGQVGQALGDTARQKLTVQADTLDHLWQEHAGGQPVDFLKMDIEGAEYEALDGATELLRNTRKVVIAAYHLRDGVRTAEKVAARLRAAGFHPRIEENHHVYAWRDA